jgi:hypothetical protein
MARSMPPTISPDSLLEGTGFELLVPGGGHSGAACGRVSALSFCAPSEPLILQTASARASASPHAMTCRTLVQLPLGRPRRRLIGLPSGSRGGVG